MEKAKPKFTYYMFEHVPEQVTNRFAGIPLSRIQERYFLILPEDAVKKTDDYDAREISHRAALIQKDAFGNYGAFVYLDNAGKLVDPSDVSLRGKKAVDEKHLSELRIADVFFDEGGKITMDLNSDGKKYYKLVYGKIPKRDVAQNDDGSLSLTLRAGDVGPDCIYTARVLAEWIMGEGMKSGRPRQ